MTTKHSLFHIVQGWVIVGKIPNILDRNIKAAKGQSECAHYGRSWPDLYANNRTIKITCYYLYWHTDNRCRTKPLWVELMLFVSFRSAKITRWDWITMIRDELNIEPLLLFIETSQLRWLGLACNQNARRSKSTDHPECCSMGKASRGPPY